MKSFRNDHTLTGKFYINGSPISFNGIFKTENQDIINQLSNADNWTEVDAPIQEEKQLSKKELKKAERKELAEKADKLGMTYPQNISSDKLKLLIEVAEEAGSADSTFPEAPVEKK